MRRIFDNIPVSLGLLVVAAVVTSQIVPSNYIGGLVALSCVYALLGLSVNLIYGYLGYTSFGHAAFLGLGAYTGVIFSAYAGISFWLATALALVPGAALGIMIGFASLRISGVYFAIVSLTIAEILRLVADNWIGLTNGPAGLIMPRPDTSWLGALGLSYNQSYLVIAMVVTGVSFIAVHRLLTTPTGSAWAAIRAGQDLSESLGIPTLRYRVGNVALSGALGALTGALLIPKILVVTPSLLSPHYSAIGLLIVVLGGRGSLLGPIIGGVLFACLPELLRGVGELRIAIFALLLLVVVRILPDGISTLLTRGAKDIAPKAPADADGLNATDVEALPDSVLLEVNGLTKRFRGLTALNDVSFKVLDGEIVGLMGPNGAGKSTLVSSISGFLKTDTGTVTFAGRTISGDAPHRVARAGLVRTFQHTTLFQGMTVFRSVFIATQSRFPSSQFASFFRTASYRRQEAARIHLAWKVLRQVGLDNHADRLAGEMSYGEQRLLSIALALAAKPRLLLLDEPAAGLNPVEASTLADLLRRLRASGLSIILVEHNVRMMMELCDRLVVLHHGEKINEGKPAAVRADERVQAAYFGVAQAT